MKRRSFLALLGLAPAAAHVVSKTAVVPADVPRPAPFALDSGVARMNAAHIDAVTAGTLKSTDGRVVIDLGAGSATIT